MINTTSLLDAQRRRFFECIDEVMKSSRIIFAQCAWLWVSVTTPLTLVAPYLSAYIKLSDLRYRKILYHRDVIYIILDLRPDQKCLGSIYPQSLTLTSSGISFGPFVFYD